MAYSCLFCNLQPESLLLPALKWKEIAVFCTSAGKGWEGSYGTPSPSTSPWHCSTPVLSELEPSAYPALFPVWSLKPFPLPFKRERMECLKIEICLHPTQDAVFSFPLVSSIYMRSALWGNWGYSEKKKCLTSETTPRRHALLCALSQILPHIWSRAGCN